MVRVAFAAMIIGAIGIVIFDPDSVSGPDAEEQEKVLTECLRKADFRVESEIPPAGRSSTPEYRLEVTRGGEEVAYIYLFDYSGTAETFVENARLDAENDDRESTIKQRGAAAVSLDRGARTTPAIHACVDRASDPPR